MKTASAFTMLDSIVGITVGALTLALGTVAAGPEHNRSFNVSHDNLRSIAAAAVMYQNDNDNYLPITLTYPRGTGPNFPPGAGMQFSGWCTWSYGGKHNSSFWASQFGGIFDCEADDRPLNRYLYPGHSWGSPPRPQRLPANSPLRDSLSAKLNRDPADTFTAQRNWPNITPGVSTYNDVGTSYVVAMGWWDQLFGQLSFEAAMNEGTRRIARHLGVKPDRFVWNFDGIADTVPFQTNPNFVRRNWWGDDNTGLMLFLDGHVGYHGLTPNVYNTAEYALQFED